MGINLNHKPTFEHNRTVYISLGFIVILGFALRIYDLGRESYWIDELYMIEVAQIDLKTFFNEIVPGGRSPLYPLLSHFWMQLFGTTEIATRSLSVAAGTAAIGIMYAVGRELFGKKVGLISALLLALSGLQILNSQTNRYYGLYVCVALLSYLFFIKMLRSGSRRYLILYVVASTLMFYTHTTAVFVFAAQGLYFLSQWNHYKELRARWILSQALIIVGIVPGLSIVYLTGLRGLVFDSTVQQGGALSPLRNLNDPSVLDLLHIVRRYIFYRMYWASVLVGVFFVMGATLLFALRQGRVRWLASVRNLATGLSDFSNKRSELLLVVFWLLGPIVIPFVLSKVISPMVNLNYTVPASPALYLLLALGISAIHKVVPEPVSVGFIVIIIVVGLQDYYVNPVRVQWREAAGYVAENAGPGDVLVFADGWYTRPGFYWYYQGRHLPECEQSEPRQPNELKVAALAQCTADSHRVWLIKRGRFELDESLAEFFNPDLEYVHPLADQSLYGVRVYLFELEQGSVSKR